jgi:hypothetical protein
MSMAGGPGAKLGVTFEGLWTARTLARLLLEEIAAVHLEPPRGQGIEFTVENLNGTREHHQCKTRSNRPWSIRDLKFGGVLAALVERTGNGDQFVFASSMPCKDIEGLTDLARKAESFDEFNAALGGDRADRFRLLCQDFGLPEAEGWARLQRSDFRHQDARSIQQDAEHLLASAITGDAARAVGDLFAYSIVQTSRRVTAAGLWADVAFTRRGLQRDPGLLATIGRLRERYLEAALADAIAGHHFIRPEVDEIVTSMANTGGVARTVLVADAGVGKSVALSQVVRALQARSVLCLPLRLDRIKLDLEPEIVGQRLGLGGSPGTVLGGVAAGDRAVLVIDQLDAISQVSGRNPEYLACIESILREVEAFPNVGVILACRQFDLDADPRLGALKSLPEANVVELAGLRPTEIDEVLRHVGVDPAAVSAEQRTVLASPLHLRMFADAPSSSFRSAIDLYERVWETKRRTSAAAAPHALEIVDALCVAAAQRRRLFVPSAVLGRWDLEVEALLSEGLLVRSDDGEIGFFHEGFFDFMAAKTMSAHDVRLIDFLASTHQDLFHRSQTRQILAYRRDKDRFAYLRDIGDLLGSSSVRFHLKSMATDWLQTVADPSAEEWEVIRPLLDHTEGPLFSRLVRLIRHPAWFDLADRRGAIEDWLLSDIDEYVNAAVDVLARVQRSRGARVAEILARLPRDTEAWRARIRWLVQVGDLGADRRFFDLVLELTRDGTLDGVTRVFVSNDSFWDLGRPLKGAARTGWFSALAAAYLHRRTDLANAAGITNPFNDREWIPDPLDRSAFIESARADPSGYVTELLPFMRRIIESNTEWNEHEQRWEDEVWRYRHPGADHATASVLLDGMAEALALLAQREPARFESVAGEMATAQSETLDFLLVRAYASAPAATSERAAAFLIERPVRLHAGYLSDQHWAARELVAKVVPEIGPIARLELEQVILAYYPHWERTPRALGNHGAAQHTLLSGIADRLSGPAQRRFDELVRKFGRQPEAPSAPHGGRVESPIDPARIKRMSDKQWIGAVSKYSADRMYGRSFERSGGALELSRQFGEAVAREPRRFVSLALRFPEGTNEAYFDASLRALEKAYPSAHLDQVWALIRRANALPGGSCTRVICDLIAAIAATDVIPNDVIGIVTRYAIADPDPPSEVTAEPRPPAPDDGDEDFAPSGYEQMELLNRGLNSNRGRAALALGKAIWAQPALLARFEATLDALTRDGSPAVRVCAVEALLPVLAIDRDAAVAMYLVAVGDDATVAASEPSARFLRYALRTHFSEVERVLELLLNAEGDSPNRIGAREAVLASFDEGLRAQVYADRAMAGGRGARFGAAEVFAANIGDEAIGDRCDLPLRVLFNDPDPRVRTEAASAFRSFEGGELASHLALLAPFMESPAIADEPSDVLAAILRISGQLPEIAADVSLRILDAAGTSAGDIRTANSADMPDIWAIAIRLNAFGSERGRERGLDVFDRLCELQAYGAERALESFERW